jgi:hypothetical protein
MEAETRKHIQLVARYLGVFANEMIKRGILHDESKLEEPEKSVFEKYTPLLSGVEFGSAEYKALCAKMKPAIDHHQRWNRHHPEFNDINGYSVQTLNDSIKSMDLFDVVEMICDWLASSKRHEGGSIGKSIGICVGRFKIEPQLEALLRNTAAIIELRAEGLNRDRDTRKAERET